LFIILEQVVVQCAQPDIIALVEQRFTLLVHEEHTVLPDQLSVLVVQLGIIVLVEQILVQFVLLGIEVLQVHLTVCQFVERLSITIPNRFVRSVHLERALQGLPLVSWTTKLLFHFKMITGHMRI